MHTMSRRHGKIRIVGAHYDLEPGAVEVVA
jgi:hypothetical protein